MSQEEGKIKRILLAVAIIAVIIVVALFLTGRQQIYLTWVSTDKNTYTIGEDVEVKLSGIDLFSYRCGHCFRTEGPSYFRVYYFDPELRDWIQVSGRPSREEEERLCNYTERREPLFGCGIINCVWSILQTHSETETWQTTPREIRLYCGERIEQNLSPGLYKVKYGYATKKFTVE